MRIFLLIVLVGLASGAGVEWWPRTDRESREKDEALRLKAEAALGMRRMLRAHPNLDFRDVVVGRVLEGGHVDFRGQVERNGRVEAVYGLASVHCADDLAAAECWDLKYLEANGTLVSLEPEPLPEEASDTQSTVAAAVEDPAPADPVVEAPAVELAAATANPEPTAAEDAPPEDTSVTHKVAKPVINTRSGPGTDNPVLTRLNAGARLALIKTSGGWGNFVILDGKEGGQAVWAALSLVEEAAQ